MGTFGGCSVRAPSAPPQFSDVQRAPTGSSGLEERIVEALVLETMTQDELRRELKEGVQPLGEASMGRFTAVTAARDEVGLVARRLHQRALESVEDEAKLVDALDFSMSHGHWSTCARQTLDYLELRYSAGAFLVRALCLARSGLPGQVKDNLDASHELLPWTPEVLDQVEVLIAQRSGDSQVEAADPSIVRQLVAETRRRGLLDRLFVQHLLGLLPERTLGTFEPGGVTDREIRDVLLSRSVSYRYCHEKQSHGAHPPLGGSTDVQFTVGGLGTIESLEITASRWDDHPRAEQVEACLLEQMRRLRFPRTRFGVSRDANHRFSFGRQDSR